MRLFISAFFAFIIFSNLSFAFIDDDSEPRSHLLSAVSVEPMNKAAVDKLINDGKEYFETGNIKEAIELWKKVSSLSPEAKYNLAGAYASEGKTQNISKAIDLFNEIVSETGNCCRGHAALILGEISTYGTAGTVINEDTAGKYLEIAMEHSRGSPVGQKAFDLYILLAKKAAHAFDANKNKATYQRVLNFLRTAQKWVRTYDADNATTLDEDLKSFIINSKKELSLLERIRLSIPIFGELFSA